MIRLTFLKIALYITVAAHYALFIGLMASPVPLFLYTPWYVSVPLVSWVINIATLRGLRCPLTELENYIRRKMGIPEIKGFVSRWILFRER